jgi:hypothetical protein
VRDAVEGVTKYTGYLGLVEAYDKDGDDGASMIQRAEDALEEKKNRNGDREELTEEVGADTSRTMAWSAEPVARHAATGVPATVAAASRNIMTMPIPASTPTNDNKDAIISNFGPSVNAETEALDQEYVRIKTLVKKAKESGDIADTEFYRNLFGIIKAYAGDARVVIEEVQDLDHAFVGVKSKIERAKVSGDVDDLEWYTNVLLKRVLEKARLRVLQLDSHSKDIVGDQPPTGTPRTDPPVAFELESSSGAKHVKDGRLPSKEGPEEKAKESYFIPVKAPTPKADVSPSILATQCPRVQSPPDMAPMETTPTDVEPTAAPRHADMIIGWDVVVVDDNPKTQTSVEVTQKAPKESLTSMACREICNLLETMNGRDKNIVEGKELGKLRAILLGYNQHSREITTIQ